MSATEMWFMAWGFVERERRITGDPSAIPKGLMPGSTGGSGPPTLMASLPAILDMHATVDKAIGPKGLLRRLMEAVYRDGWVLKRRVVFVFPDGSRSDVMPEYAEPPAGYDTVEDAGETLVMPDMRQAIQGALEVRSGRYEPMWQMLRESLGVHAIEVAMASMRKFSVQFEKLHLRL